jgi:hypothetical protein
MNDLGYINKKNNAFYVTAVGLPLLGRKWVDAGK